MTLNLALRKGVDHVGVTLVSFFHDGQGNFLMNRRPKLLLHRSYFVLAAL